MTVPQFVVLYLGCGGLYATANFSTEAGQMTLDRIAEGEKDLRVPVVIQTVLSWPLAVVLSVLVQFGRFEAGFRVWRRNVLDRPGKHDALAALPVPDGYRPMHPPGCTCVRCIDFEREMHAAKALSDSCSHEHTEVMAVCDGVDDYLRCVECHATRPPMPRWYPPPWRPGHGPKETSR